MGSDSIDFISCFLQNQSSLTPLILDPIDFLDHCVVVFTIPLMGNIF